MENYNFFSRLKVFSIIGVVFIHAANNNPAGFSFFISKSLFSSSVYIFFAVSGFFLFKKKIELFEVYLAELTKRIRTILVPFVLWNLIIILLSIITLKLAPQFSNGGQYSLKSTSAIEIFTALVGVSRYPIHYQFWFLRNLIIIILISYPFKKLIIKSEIIAAILSFVIDNYIPGCFPFIIGAILSKKVNLNYNVKNPELLAITSISSLLFASTLKEQHAATILISAIFIISISSIRYAESISKILDAMSNRAFFIYAAHEPTITITSKIINKLKLNLSAGINFMVLFFFSMFICITISTIMNKYTRNIYATLTGAR